VIEKINKIINYIEIMGCASAINKKDDDDNRRIIRLDL
jgi:hypothetical protein